MGRSLSKPSPPDDPSLRRIARPRPRSCSATVAVLAVPIADPAASCRRAGCHARSSAPDPIAIARRVEPWKIGPIAEQYLDLFE